MYLLIYPKQKSKLHNSAKPIIFASEDIYIFGTINTYQESRKENNSTLTFDNDPYRLLPNKWFSNNIQILLYKYQKITFKSFQRVVYSTNSSWKYSKKYSLKFLLLSVCFGLFLPQRHSLI